jgi:hypothetical protein
MLVGVDPEGGQLALGRHALAAHVAGPKVVALGALGDPVVREDLFE